MARLQGTHRLSLPGRRVSLILPSGTQSPLSSPELLYSGEAIKDAPGKLKPCSIPSLALGPAQALELLMALPATWPHGMSIGASLLYWAEAAKLSVELGEKLLVDRFGWPR